MAQDQASRERAQLAVARLLMIYPYFAGTVPLVVGIGAAIGIALWWAVRLGW